MTMARPDDPFTPFTEVDRTRYAEVASRAKNLAHHALIERMHTTMESARESCESPMEELLAVAFAPWTIFPMVHVEYQAEVGPYRADFLVTFFGMQDDEEYRVAVEVDGHEFHEKTKEQAERDKKRDRHFVNSKLPVMRFTGREVYRDPEACVNEVMGYLRSMATGEGSVDD